MAAPPHPPQNHRYYSITSRLPRLPRELVHEIIDDLTIQKILEIVCYSSIPYLDECVTSHRLIGKVLPAEEFPEIKKYFALYLKIRDFKRGHPRPGIEPLQSDASSFLDLELRNRKFPIIPQVQHAALKMLEAYHPFLHVLNQVVNPTNDETLRFPDREFWDTKSADSLEEIFSLVDQAEVKLMTQKRDQLGRMADLLERYPKFIHTCCEKSQEARHNQQHRVDYLRHIQSKMQDRQIVDGRFFGRIIFAQEQFYLVPYDKVLRVFLKTLDRFPPKNKGVAAKGASGDEVVAKERSGTQSTKALPHDEYPKDLELVLSGLSDRNPPRVLNTRYSGYQEKRSASEQPSFFIYPSHPTPRKMQKWNGLRPMAEKEFQWLEAFLTICEYMSNMQDEWSAGQTVADYWRTHVLA